LSIEEQSKHTKIVEKTSESAHRWYVYFS